MPQAPPWVRLPSLMGCRVIGIAGGQAKCQWLIDELGYDAVIDYKSESVDARMQELCKNSIDMFFDNVGGEILDSALVNMANQQGAVCSVVVFPVAIRTRSSAAGTEKLYAAGDSPLLIWKALLCSTMWTRYPRPQSS